MYEPGPRTPPPQWYGPHPRNLTFARYLQHLGGTASHSYVFFAAFESHNLVTGPVCFYSVPHTWLITHCMKIIKLKAYLCIPIDTNMIPYPMLACSMYLQIGVYIHLYIIYIYFYIHIYIYTHTFMYIHICIYIYTYIYIHTYIHTDRQTDRQTDIHTYTRTHIHIHIYIYIYTYTYTHHIYIYIHTPYIYTHTYTPCTTYPCFIAYLYTTHCIVCPYSKYCL